MSLVKKIKKGTLVCVVSGSFKGTQAKIAKVCLRSMVVFLDGCYYKNSITSDESGKKSYSSKHCPIHISKIKLC